MFSQIDIDWLKLRNVYYMSEFREDVSEYIQVARFGESVESLDNKEVRITGYMLTLSPDEGIFVLSEIWINSTETIGGRSMGFFAKNGKLIAVIIINIM